MKWITEKVNRTLFELEIGISLFGVVCQMFVFLPENKINYSAGLWIGILTAALSAFHMWYTLDKGLDFDEKSAIGYLGRQNIIRYLAIVIVLIIVAVSHIGNPLSAFLGIMGLKAAAYMQPLIKRVSKFLYGEEILPEMIEEPADRQE